MNNDFHQIRMRLGSITGESHWLRHAEILNSIDSTNLYAKTLLRGQLPLLPALIIADEQTAGRGRLQRFWHSPAGTGLWFSLIQSITVCDYWPGMALKAGIITAKAIHKATGLICHLKWPNDVLIAQKKCAGILIETVLYGEQMYMITGVGININQISFPSEIRDVATSPCIESGKTFDRSEVLYYWIKFAENYEEINRRNIIDEWKTMSKMIGKSVIVMEKEKIFEAQTLDLADDGGLIIQTNNDIRTLYAADIQVRLKNDQ